MANDKHYPNSSEFHQRKLVYRQTEARRPISEKMAAVRRLRDFERKLENVREANRAKRAGKQIRIEFKTR